MEELAWLERESIPDLSPENYLGWTKACICGGSIPVHQDGLDEVIGVERACLRCVVSDESLGMFDSEFGSFVGLGIVSS